MGKRAKIVIIISLIYVLAIFISLNGGDIVNIFMCGVHIFGLFFVIFTVMIRWSFKLFNQVIELEYNYIR